MAFDLCSSRHCNICLLFETEAVPTTNNASDETNSTTVMLKRPSLRRCNGCQIVLYCNREHQKMDWSLHRELCRATQKMMTVSNTRHPFLVQGHQPSNADEMERAIVQVKFLLRAALGRALLFHEEELTSFPLYCQVCYSFRNLQSCGRCQAVSYCSEAHAIADQVRHNRNCGLLQLYYTPYKAQSLSANIFEFYRRVPDLHKTDLFEAFSRATLKSLPTQPTASLKSYQLFSTAADFSCIGTICYALGFTEMRCYDNAKFVIFIVGATFEQHLWFQDLHTKFFFLQFPQITLLCMFFIGPEAEGENTRSVYTFQGHERCVQYITYHGFFQNFSKEFNIKPSIIVSFNCGFSEHMHEFQKTTIPVDVGDNDSRQSSPTKDTWSLGILDMLLTFDVPIVFTSYTCMEANFDYATVLRIAQSDKQSIHVSRIFNVKQNPFRDLRPLRYWRVQNTDEIYYRNGYVQALRAH